MGEKLTRKDERHLKKCWRDMNASDRVVLGEVSGEVYDKIAALRKFDKFCRLVPEKKEEEDELLSNIKKQLEKLSSQHTSDNRRAGRGGRATQDDAQVLSSDRRYIRRKVQVFGPPNCAPARPGLLESEDNEGLYNYDGDWKDGKPHRHGFFIFADGKTFKGQWASGKPHGEGVATYPNGIQYCGTWRHGRFNGQGSLKSNNGTCYSGNWRDGKRHGYGVQEYPSGLVYKGDWKFDVPYGYGDISSSQTGIKFSGRWQNGVIYGPGTLHMDDDEVYARDWCQLGGWSFKQLVEYVLDEKMETKRSRELEHAKVHQLADNVLVQEYVQDCRDEVYRVRREERAKLKAERARARERRAKKKLQAQLEAMRGVTFEDG